ncbi:MAG TPA: peptidase C14, caspase catalytic subunit p20 [Cyanobacteria bacterium UBA8803]|nr:peptidase C14, caspase catalytic subunit p20 [Cyanobacteria bacterium UBA8803]
MKRRQFLQFATSTLATIGFSHLNIIRQGERYGKVLAQNTPRKLALLVGINEYPKSDRFRNLQGCLTDVELQRQLLIHRFGFKNTDIYTLTNDQATRQGILTTFDEHLIQQAKPGDVVVFHFSGHGSRIFDPNPINPQEKLNSTFVPADDHPLSQQGIVNDILGHTLFLLMYALKQKTENITVVLDSCHSGGGTRGNVRVRNVRGGEDFKISSDELAEQQKWLAKLQLSPQKFIEERNLGVAAGVAIASTQPSQLAADYEFPGFSAGAFTYLLTQYLWQQPSDVESAIALVNRKLNSLPVSNQNPLYEVKPNSGNGKKPVYFIQRQVPPAEAVVTEVNGNEVTLWLGGIEPDSFDAFGEGAAFTSVSENQRGLTKVQLQSRQGLTGRAIVEGTVQPGQVLQEFARAIPKDWQMRIGIDSSLGTDALTAQTTLQTINRIEPVLAQSGTSPYPKDVHYIFSRMTPAYRQQLQQDGVTDIPPDGSIGLFSQALELVPDSFDVAGESVEDAIARLRSKIRGLLAARIIKLTLNAQSSKLDLAVTMKLEQGNKLIAQAFTVRGCKSGTCQGSSSRGTSQPLTPTLLLEEPFAFEVTNRESQPLYLGILSIDPAGKMNVLFPNEFQRESNEELDQATQIAANQTLLIPNPEKDDFVLVTDSRGKGEMLILASPKPLTKALLRLRNLRGSQRGPFELTEPVEVIGDLLDDLSRSARAILRSQLVNPAEMAALSITFEVQ